MHIPFCVRKCEYCDFLSAPADERLQNRYVGALLHEIRYYGQIMGRPALSTIYIGGGTPSLLAPEYIALLLKQIQVSFEVETDVEITIECNPGTLNEEKLLTYKEAGINRLSIGLQSAFDDELKILGRIHTYRQFLENYECARRCGFENINVDLMSALPYQSTEKFVTSLKRVIALKPEHISAYSLIIEKGTPFYEIGYWKRVPYLGVGLGAASLIGEVRYSNIREIEAYIKACGNISAKEIDGVPALNLHESADAISRHAQMEEFMFLGLRMLKGVTRTEFKETFGVEIEAVYGEVLNQLQEEDLIEKKAGVIKLSDHGMDISNYVLAQFLLD